MNIWAWLRMMSVGGEFPAQTSEAVYNANLGQIDVAMPLNGGKLQADGTWLQEPWKLDHEWAQNLPGIAESAGHSYMPTVDNDSEGLLLVLDDPVLHEMAAQNLVQLATSGRFDSPWDGVVLNLEGIPSAYKSQMSQLLYTLSYHIRRAGLQCVVATRGKNSDPGPEYDEVYGYDFQAISQVADHVLLFCYGYWKPIQIIMDRSLAPYWWVRECVEYALSSNIPRSKLSLGMGTYSLYYPDSSTNTGRAEITYTEAVRLVNEANARPEWIERGAFGLVRERLADLGPGHTWIQDGDTAYHYLELVKSLGLEGLAMFVLGAEDPRCWNIIMG